MIRSDRKPSSGEEPPAFSISVLPDELLIEILSRLPGKQIGRCKCVRKPWRSIIGSRIFTETYRKRQRGLLLCWPEEIKRDDRLVGQHLRFFHCPLRRSVEPPEKFSPLRELRIWTGVHDTDHPLFVYGVTQLVNGLLCIGEAVDVFGSYIILTVRNICTGEMMRIPDPPYIRNTGSTYHLGYDPVRRMYKLLRLIFRFFMGKDVLERAQIMDLRPPLDTWRELEFCSAGMCVFTRDCLLEERTSPGDGVMCWLQKRFSRGHGQQQLLCFDVNKESFRILEHPVAGPGLEMLKVEGVTHAITRFNDSLVIWFSSSEDDFSGISCYVQEDDKGKSWRKKHIEFSEALKERGGFVVESGNHPSFSLRGEMLVRNPDQSWRVYSYSRLLNQHIDKEDVLFVGKLPDGAPGLSYTSHLRQWYRFNPGSLSSVFSFSDSNTLYQSLDDVLGAGSAAM